MHQSMQHVLKSENSQKKTGIYLKLNLGLKALLVINGLMSWVLLDRGDIVFRNHSTLWTVRRDLLSRLSELQLMSNISRTLVPKSRCCSPSQSRVPCSEELELSLKDEVWPSDIVTFSLTCIIFVPHLSLHIEISLLHKSSEGWLAPESCNLPPDQSF